MSEQLIYLPADSDSPFPDPTQALLEPNGLLAVGGDLSSTRLIRAYRSGIFPWFSDGDPILWWSPDPRAVLYPGQLHISKSLRKTLRNKRYDVSFDQAFDEVIAACAESRTPRAGETAELGTWITDEMSNAYQKLFTEGVAHSIEVREGSRLVGGLYGLSIGRVFFGESMFSRVSDASKVAMAYLCTQLAAWDFAVIDCQVASSHISSLGAIDIPRKVFCELVTAHCDADEPQKWQFDDNSWQRLCLST